MFHYRSNGTSWGVMLSLVYTTDGSWRGLAVYAPGGLSLLAAHLQSWRISHEL
jgi:hypothetical protein